MLRLVRGSIRRVRSSVDPWGLVLSRRQTRAALRDDTRRVLVGQSNTFNAITQVNIDIDVNVNVKQETEIPNPPDLSSIPPAPVEAPPRPGVKVETRMRAMALKR